MRAFSQLFKFFSPRYLHDNALTGTIPPQISTLSKLYLLYVPNLIQFIECCHVLIECWSCAPLSHIFKRSAFFLYRNLRCNGLTGTIPALISALVELQNLWALTSFLIRVGQSPLHFSFDQCWSCAPLSCSQGLQGSWLQFVDG